MKIPSPRGMEGSMKLGIEMRWLFPCDCIVSCCLNLELKKFLNSLLQ